MNGKQQLMLALAAAVAGLAWGYINRRGERRSSVFALLQGLEWFVASGGAAVLVELVREALEEDDEREITERVTHVTETVTDGA